MSDINKPVMEKALEMFRESGALLNGHFRLTSGLHSPSYFQCALVLQHPAYSEYLAAQIANRFRSSRIDLVIAPAIGGIVVGQEVGRQLQVRTIFAERKDGEMQIRRGFSVTPGARVLVCEDVVTTGGSVKEVIDQVIQQGGIIAGVGYIVDRSNGKVTFGVDRFAVVQLETVAYSPDDCPLCQKQIPIVKPGSRST